MKTSTQKTFRHIEVKKQKQNNRTTTLQTIEQHNNYNTRNETKHANKIQRNTLRNIGIKKKKNRTIDFPKMNNITIRIMKHTRRKS